MKTKLPLVLAALTIFSAAPVFAAARAPSNEGRDYVEGARDLSKWSWGAYYDLMKRQVEIDGRELAADLSHYMTYAAYDALPYLVPYVAVGLSDSSFGNSGADDSKFEVALGAHLNLLDHEIADPMLMEDRIRISGNVEYSATSGEYWGEDLRWATVNASLTLGFVNDVAGNFLHVPDSIALYAGPMYSTLLGSDIELANSESDLGLTAGLEVYYTPRVSLYAQANFFDETGVSAGLNVHF
jgi:hypothetical protein